MKDKYIILIFVLFLVVILAYGFYNNYFIKNIEDDTDYMSKIIEYEDMVNILVDDGYSKEEAKNYLLENKDERIDDIKTAKFVEANVGSIYSKEKNQRVYVYAYFTNIPDTGNNDLKDIQHINIDAGSKYFDGEVYFNIEAGNKIYFSIYGSLVNSKDINKAKVFKTEVNLFNVKLLSITDEEIYDIISDSFYYSSYYLGWYAPLANVK